MDQEEMLNDLAERIQRMQLTAKEKAVIGKGTVSIERGFHAKGTGVRAKFRISQDIPIELQVDFFKPGAEYEALVRFSNARGEVLSDLAKDQRGAAIRIRTIGGETLKPDDYSDIQDFLMTNTPISFARNPVQFIEIGEILLGGTAMVPFRLIRKYGLKEARRILGVFLAPLISFNPFQMNQYWSRTSYQFGEHAVRYLIRPAKGSKLLTSLEQFLGVARSLFLGTPQKEHYLREKLKEGLLEGDLHFEFCVQLFVDDKKTPVEDAYIEWLEADSPPIPIATITIPRQEADKQLQVAMEKMAFNPWNTKEINPLGLINLARKKVYDASAINRESSLNLPA